MSRARPHLLLTRMRGFSAGVLLVFLLFALITTFAGWVYSGMVTAERWPIHWLKLNGPFERVSTEQIRASLTPFLEDSFFTVDTGRMRDITDAMPWISNVTVQKIWPDEIKITIQEHTPVAHWVDGELIAANGQRFKVPSADKIQGLVWLEGSQSQLNLVLENWKKLEDRLVVIGQQVERFTLDARGSWSVRLNGGTELRLGKGDFFSKLDLLLATWAALMQDQPLPPISIDLRYTNGFAVLWPKNMDSITGNYGENS